ncbi:MAG: Ig-like domain-containing protein [bacterium]
MKRVIMAMALLAFLGVIFAACGGGGGGGGSATPPPGTIPLILSVFPADGADQVVPDIDIQINFNEAMNKTSVQSNTAIASVAGTPFSAISYNWQATDTQMVISPTTAFADSTKYVVTIDSPAEDAQGDSLASAYMFSFTTGDVPIATFEHPWDSELNVAIGTTIGISFSEPMNTTSVKDNFSFVGAGYADSLFFSWTLSDTALMVSFATSLDPDATYTATIIPIAEDLEGTPLNAISKVTFSTSGALATGSISGVIFDDPDSSFDDSLEDTFVALFDHNFMDTQGPQPILAQSDASGAYHFSYLSSGLYYVLGLQDTNGDGEIGGDDLTKGDSVGYYFDVTQGSAGFYSVSVATAAETGVDFTLLDSEAIIGDVSYAGLNTTLAYSSNAYIGAFTSTDISGSPPYSAVAESVDGFDPGTNLWDYSINSYFTSPFGTRLPIGSYYVGAFIDINNSGDYSPDLNSDGDYDDGEPAGMFLNAFNSVSILVTGQDVIGVDITTYDAITLFGEVNAVSLASPIVTSPFVDTPYQNAEVSLLNYPLTAATDASGDFIMDFVPMGPTLAVRGKAAAGSTLISWNNKYKIFDTSNAYRPISHPFSEPERLNLVSPSVVSWIGSQCSVTIDFNKAQIGGSVRDTVLDVDIVGAEVLFTGPAVNYIDTQFNCSTTGLTKDNGGGLPQFFIFNVDAALYTDNKASISASDSSGIIDSAIIPVRNGEFTYGLMEK